MIDMERVAEARAHLTRALELHRTVGHRFAIAQCLANLGYVELVGGNLEEAMKRNEQALPPAEHVGHQMCITVALNNLAETAAAAADSITARHRYRECIALARRLGQLDRICLCADGLAVLALGDGDAPLDVRFLSASATARQQHGITLEHRYQLAHEQAPVAGRTALGAAEFNTQWKAGQTLDVLGSTTSDRPAVACSA